MLNLIILLLVVPALHATQFPYLYTGPVDSSGDINVYSAYNTAETHGVATLQAVSGQTAPDAIAITSDSKHAYVASSTGGTPYKIVYYNLTDNSSTTVSTALATASSVPQLALTPDGKYLLVTRDQKLAVINTTTNTEVSGSPFTLTGLPTTTNVYPIAISPIFSTSYTVFIGCVTTNNILPLTVSVSSGSASLGSTFAVGANTNAGLAITPNGSTLYVANNPTGAVNRLLYPVNTSSHVVGTAITITDTTLASTLIIHPNGNTAYVLTGTTGVVGNVDVINLTTQTFTTSIASTGKANNAVIPACCFSADGLYLYVPVDASTNVIRIISTASNTITATITQTSSTAGMNFVAIRESLGGSLDTTFGNQGYTLTPLSRVDTVQSLAIQSNDNILVTGTTQATAPTSAYLARYTTNGILDSSFNASSTPGYYILTPSTLSSTTIACASNAVALDANQNILIAGYAAQSPTTMLLARFTSAGVLDTTFNSGGTVPGVVTQSVGTGEGVTANAVGVQSATYSSRIIVAGTSTNNGVPSFTLAAFNASTGALDTSFGGTSIGYRIDTFGNVSILNAMVIPGATATYADNIFVVGIVDNQAVVAWYDPTGNLLQTYSPVSDIANQPGPVILSSAAYDLAYIDANDQGSTSPELYIAGSATVAGNTTIQSFIFDVDIPIALSSTFNAPNGSGNTPFGFVLQSVSYGSEFYSVTTQPNNNIVAGGYAIGALTNQISLANYQGYTMGANEGSGGSNGFTYGTLNYYWNSNNGPSLTTIGSLTAAQKVRCQSNGQVITAGTADGTYYVARFNGDTTTTP